MSADIEPEVGIGSPEYTAQLPRKRMAATVLFTDGEGRFLVCDPTYKQVLDLPGGAVESDESPLDAAVREVKEELGLTVAPNRLIAVDFVPPQQGRTEAVVFVFDGGTLTGTQTAAIRLDPTELRSWQWANIADVQERMRPLLVRRLQASLDALATGRTAYLENGHPILEGHRLWPWPLSPSLRAVALGPGTAAPTRPSAAFDRRNPNSPYRTVLSLPMT